MSPNAQMSDACTAPPPFATCSGAMKPSLYYLDEVLTVRTVGHHMRNTKQDAKEAKQHAKQTYVQNPLVLLAWPVFLSSIEIEIVEEYEIRMRKVPHDAFRGQVAKSEVLVVQIHERVRYLTQTSRNEPVW